ncbi:hypothetical protein SDJN02_25290, partial [Cucurbita argyrosperma subsp. argyrosperma]
KREDAIPIAVPALPLKGHFELRAPPPSPFSSFPYKSSALSNFLSQQTSPRESIAAERENG